MNYTELMSVYGDAYRYAVDGGQGEDSAHKFAFYVSEQFRDYTLDEYLTVANMRHLWVRYSETVVAQ